MGSFYAGMSTTVSVMLSGLREPRGYTAPFILTDPLTATGRADQRHEKTHAAASADMLAESQLA